MELSVRGEGEKEVMQVQMPFKISTIKLSFRL